MVTLISHLEFIKSISSVLKRSLNESQTRCIEHAQCMPLMIVAGPGSGKTTVLVLRALRHILVDGMPTDKIIITTFTKKAAAEISSRVLSWGLALVDHFTREAKESNNVQRLQWLSNLDINSVRTGTLDSFCQDWLKLSRSVGEPQPIMLEKFAADFIFKRRVFASKWRSHSDDRYKDFLSNFNFDQMPLRTQGEACAESIKINDRLIQDRVNLEAFANKGFAYNHQVELLKEFKSYLEERHMYDFSTCAERISRSLVESDLYNKIGPLSALLIDEYQDTNPLQESIYFELAKQSSCSVTVVGDDDQALYRFRGATVELFTNFPDRLKNALDIEAVAIEYLITNYRSTPEIISFFNRFISYDTSFYAARVQGKPKIVESNPSRGVPVLGLFRPSIEELSKDLAGFLFNVFRGGGVRLPDSGPLLKGFSPNGDIGDAVLLCSSVREFKDNNQGGTTDRLPSLIRNELSRHGLGVFNPRGQDLRDIPRMKVLLGLMLLCLDPDGELVLNTSYLLTSTNRYIEDWRAAANEFISSDPYPGGVNAYLEGWRHRRSSSKNGDWPNEIPLLDLVYKLIVWIPEFQDDPEHLVYLEAVMRSIAQGSHYSAYEFTILNSLEHGERSRQAVIRDLLEPIADKLIDLDEDLLLTVPRNRLGIMTIHQSKGLEFPFVIVDVGSEFKTNHAKQAFKRFPNAPSSVTLAESEFADYTPVGSLRTSRTDLDRTFDDLMRQYFVAYSRPEVCLLLVGLDKSITQSNPIKNIATVWDRSGSWDWRVVRSSASNVNGPISLRLI